jgi:hypothetical protein
MLATRAGVKLMPGVSLSSPPAFRRLKVATSFVTWATRHRDGLHRLVAALRQRRTAIRALISKFRESIRKPFPN